MQKKIIPMALLVAMSTMLQAETLNVMVSPRGTLNGSSNPGGAGEPLFGSLSGLQGHQFDISTSPGVVEDNAKLSDTAAGAVAQYHVTFPNHPTWGEISFDLTVTASAQGGAAGLLYNGMKNKYWSVDTGDDFNYGSSLSEEDDESRIHSGESLSFKVDNLRSPGNRISSFKLNGLYVKQNGTFNRATGIFTGADGADGAGGRVNRLRFSFDIVAAP
jgi:hypothetical protein